MYYLALLVILTSVQPDIATTTSARCLTPNNEEGECVPLWSCPSLNRAVRFGDEAQQWFVNNSICGDSANDPIVCCTSATVSIKTNTTGTDSYRKQLASDRICGLQHSDDYFHTINVSALTDFPWLARIHSQHKMYSYIFGLFCGGVLINQRYVLTAASCLLNERHTLQFVRLGEYDAWNETDCLEDGRLYECTETVQDIEIEETISHPNYTEYDNGCPSNDIGLIRLKQKAMYNDYVRPICLPLPDSPKLPIDGTAVTIDCNEVRIKEKLSQTILSNDDCVPTIPIHHGHLYDRWICSQFLRPDIRACLSQIGNPLMFSRRHKWYLAGVTPGKSKGYSCFDGHKQPYTNVAHHLDWIVKNIRY